LQAYHALSSRITSLYWFNLSLPSLVKYRDTLDPLTKIGREIRLLDEFYLTGNAYDHARLLRDGKPDWDLASIACPRATLLFALDLAYSPSQEQRVFEFAAPRPVDFEFRLPDWCRNATEVFRVDADGCYDVSFEHRGESIKVTDALSRVGIYVVSAEPGLRAELSTRREVLIAYEQAFGFDPAGNDADFQQLVEFAKQLHDD
jgi:hypothetical protein